MHEHSRDFGQSNVYVASSQISRSRGGSTNSRTQQTSNSPVKGRRAGSARLHAEMTPPLTPKTSQEAIVNQSEVPEPVFHNYLRAFYPFHPTFTTDSSTVTLPLNEGDVILVHSIHTNGWADGTLLISGSRGWLPTNYCEAYDHEPIRNLLKALTNFWDLIRGENITTLETFGNQDFMRGIIAGEQSQCLNRESFLIQRHDGLRRNRKALLSDLSSLVKVAKRVQEVASGASTVPLAETVFDELILKAFKTVTRAVKFLDVWNRDIGSSDVSEQEISFDNTHADVFGVPPTPMNDTFEVPPTPMIDSFNVPPTPPADQTSFGIAVSDTQPSASYDRGMMESRASTRNAPTPRPDTAQSIRPVRSPTSQPKKASVTHRLSYSSQTPGLRRSNLASERLSSAHDCFLGFLGSFIGLHLQSRSSSELLLTTQQSVISCRNLLEVVEAVWKRDLHRSAFLEQARDVMYSKITELVQAARDVFTTGNEDTDDVLMPDEGMRLVAAATTCVRAAGDCVAKTRYVIERIGDFELETAGLGISDTILENAPESAEHFQSSNDAPPDTEKPLPAPPEPVVRPPPPPLELLQDRPLPEAPLLSPASVNSPRTIVESPTAASQRSSTKSLFPNAHLIASLSQDAYPTPESSYTADSGPFGGPMENSMEGSASTATTYLSSAPSFEGSIQSSYKTTMTTPEPMSSQQLLAPSPSAEQTSPASQTTSAEDCEETEAKVLEKTFAHELVYSKDGQIAGGTLPALVERLTTHDSTPDSMFVSTFYLTFRLFTTPVIFAEALVDRFDYVADSPQIAGPVRLRVYNVMKGWLESHWRNDCDRDALPIIEQFASLKLRAILPSAANRLNELVEKVSAVECLCPRLASSFGKTTASVVQYTPDPQMPTPIISRGQLAALRSWKSGGGALTILDFDPLELARQFTIKESKIFCSISPEELLASEWTKKNTAVAVNVRGMSKLSTDLANLVADTILHLEDAKKRALIVRQWIKIAQKCLELQNYDSLMAIICSLNSSTILRLKRTWEIVSPKKRATLENLKKIVDCSKNYAVLRQRLQNHFPPCLPFVGTYLTDLTFVDVGNQTKRQLPGNGDNDTGMSVINFDKHTKTAKIIGELQRFQIPYGLVAVPELQEWMEAQIQRMQSSDEANVQSYYRRSLKLEPRDPQASQQRPSPVEAQVPTSNLMSGSAKEKFDFLAWTHSKDKTVTTSS
ncbi:MAG: hypothetical protein M1819_005062 [Sarea resinae]|nr:MAG: hypothetical protein M1819_005062 [Sarea resinae]